ncbi:MAG: succinate dehydrogenase, hydrophobic membrane anchor protein [Calditrichia bacterium]|nr:succinate dehydrogenase, hydrophobic membrane anchor protein [Calditrichia bacterium]
MSYRFEGSNTSGSFGWFFQRITGLILFIQLFAHFFIAHNTWDAGHDWQTIVTRLSSPYMRTFYLVFVVLGLYHGLNGVWAVFRDYNMSAMTRKVVFTLIVTAGIFMGMLGIITMVTLPMVH